MTEEARGGHRVLARARPPGAVRRPRALPAAQHPARGLGAVRQRRPEDRPRVADPLPGRCRRAGRAAARRSGYAGSRRCPTRTSPAWRRTSTSGRAASPPTCRSRCGRRRSTPSRRRRRTSASWSRPASRCSRCTCRWAEFHLDDPLLDEVWGVLVRRPARRSWCTPARARSATTSPARRRWRDCWRGSRGWCWSSHTSGRRRARPSSTSPRSTTASTSTPRWCSPTSGRFPSELRPRLADLAPRILLGTDFPNIPYPYVHQLEGLARLDLGDDWLRAVCWENGARLYE